MNHIISAELTHAMDAKERYQFYDIVEQLITNDNVTKQIYFVFYDSVTRSITAVTEDGMAAEERLDNITKSVNGNVVVPIPHNYDYLPLFRLQLQIQKMVDDGNLAFDDLLMNAIITNDHNYYELPIYYSACNPRQADIKRVFKAARSKLDEGWHLRLYPMQKRFDDDAIECYGSLNKVPLPIWQLIPSIHDCYFDMFYWIYYDPTRPAIYNDDWPEVFAESHYRIRRGSKHIDSISKLIADNMPVYRVMSDREWTYLVNLLIEYDDTNVVYMAAFGKVNGNRTLDLNNARRPNKAYLAAVEALVES